jgi:hypothetical protein
MGEIKESIPALLHHRTQEFSIFRARPRQGV